MKPATNILLRFLRISPQSRCNFNQLGDTNDWFVKTPLRASISEGKVGSSWAAEAPDLDAIVRNLEGGQITAQNGSFFSTNCSHDSL